MPQKKFKILFCTPPPNRGSAIFEAFNEGASSFPPLGPLILASIARRRGHEVFFRDFLNTAKGSEGALREILALNLDCVGISSNTDMIFQASALAGGIKRAKKDILVLIGGPHISSAPFETMRLCVDFDVGFIAEAEQSFQELLDCGFSPEAFGKIKGICFRDEGEIIVNQRQPFIAELDSLPFPEWDIIEDMRAYRPAVTNFKRHPAFSLITSRGCFARCIFCDRGVFGNNVRMHSAKYVLGMIRLLCGKYGIREINFYDDNLLFDKSRIKEICLSMIEEKMNLSWSCIARVDMVDEETLRMMKEAGCWQISYGIESGSQQVLDALNKGTRVEKVREAAALMRKAGLSMRGYFIVGNPGETRDTLEETLKLILELPLDDILVEYMTPYPGTEISNNIGRYGNALGGWQTINSYKINFVPYGLTQECLKRYFFRFYKEFYLRPRSIFSYVRRLKNPLKVAGLGMKYVKFATAQKKA